MAVYKKLAEIQSTVKGLAKDKSAYNYDYVTGDKLLSHIRPMMNEMGLLLLPSVTNVDTQVVTYDAYDRNAKGIITKTEILYSVSMEMKWVDSTDGDIVIEKWAGAGMNAFDKGFGSALTYGERYYLLKTFHIPTDRDDVDAIAAERDKALESAYNAQVQNKITAQPVAQAQPAPQPKAISIDTLNKYIIGQAEGKPCKSGKSCRQAYIDGYAPTREMLATFDAAVADYKVNNNLM